MRRHMMRALLLPAALLLLGLLPPPTSAGPTVANVQSPRAKPLSPKAAAALEGLDLAGRVGQMLHLSVKKTLFDYPNDPYVDKAKVTDWLNQVQVGTITNTPFDGQRGGPNQTITGWNVTEWRTALRRIQEAAKDAGHPPILYGIDHLHGANYVMGATLFPQQINVAASFDRAHAEAMGRVMAKDTKAAGMQWIFGPVLDMHQQPQWSRCFETFGEDPYVIGQLAKAVIDGIQGPHPDFPTLPPAAATMKHFISYGNSRFGHDRAPVDVSDRTVRQMYAPPFLEAVRAGVRTAMECYIEVGGVPMVSNREYLIDLLRHEMGFEGMMITDWKEMENLWTWHMVADNARDAARVALTDTSVDIFANPTVDTQHWIYDLVDKGDVPPSRVDTSAGRVLALKEYLGLFDDPFALLNDTDPTIAKLVASVGSDADKALALDAARDSIALVKNEGKALPLRLEQGQTVVLAGAGCNSLVRQGGGWTLHWQGAFEESEFAYGTTLFEEMQASLKPKGVEVVWAEAPTAEQLAGAAAVVVCVGEGAYAEKPGDIDDAALPIEQVQEVARVATAAQQAKAPVVGVLLEGRPRILQGIPDMTQAFVHAMLPGPAGGRAIADILLGLVNPSARLPFTYPKYTGTMLHQYHAKPSEKCTNLKAAFPSFDVIDCPVEWPFGHGLSYTTFSYGGAPTLSAATIDERSNLTVRATVTNTGDVAGKEAVLLFVTDWARRVTPEYKLLKRFEKVALGAGESKEVTFTLVPEEDLSYIGVDGRRVLESGDFYLGLGPEVDCRAKPDQCTKFTLKLSDAYHAACQAACQLLRHSEEACGGVNSEEGDEEEKEKHAGPLAEKACMEACRADAEWGWPQTKCLEQAVWSGKCNVARRCRLPGRDIFNERAAAPANTTTTQQEKKKPPKNKKGRTLFAHNNQQRVSSAAPSSWFSPSFALGLLVGTLGALSLVFGARQLGRVEGGGNGSRYRYASRFEGGGRHHVLP